MDGKTDRARELRTHSTDAERCLWGALRDRRFAGWKFRRQEPLGPYIVDFICYSQRLIIEVDGSQHADRVAYDAARTRWLELQGFRVIRFWNNYVLTDTAAVEEAIWLALRDAPSP